MNSNMYYWNSSKCIECFSSHYNADFNPTNVLQNKAHHHWLRKQTINSFPHWKRLKTKKTYEWSALEKAEWRRSQLEHWVSRGWRQDLQHPAISSITRPGPHLPPMIRETNIFAICCIWREITCMRGIGNSWRPNRRARGSMHNGPQPPGDDLSSVCISLCAERKWG